MMVLFFVCGAVFFVHFRASGVRMPPAQAGLFRGGHFQEKAVARRL